MFLVLIQDIPLLFRYTGTVVKPFCREPIQLHGNPVSVMNCQSSLASKIKALGCHLRPQGF